MKKFVYQTPSLPHAPFPGAGPSKRILIGKIKTRISRICQLAAVLLVTSTVPAFSAETIRLMAERDAASSGSDLFLFTYPSLTDMVNGTNLVQQEVSIPLSSSFSFAGLTANGSGGFLLMAERDAASSGSDLFLFNYPSLTDMVNGTNLVQQEVSIPLSSSFSFAGLTANGSGGFLLMAERDDASSGSDLFLFNYPSLTDMINGTNLVQQEVSIPLSSSFSFAGFSAEYSAPPNPHSVPEGDSVFVPFLAIGSLVIFSRLLPRTGSIRRDR